MSKGIHRPEGGWKPSTWYLIKKSHGASNPVHHGLLYTGFLDSNGDPAGYSGVININCAPSSSSEDFFEVRDLYFIHPVCELVNDDGEVLVKP